MLEQLNKNHNKQGFDCGNEMLNRYLHHQASQDIKRKLAACFVHTSSREILGYYTLSNTSIPLDLLPPSIRKKLPTTYKAIPATLLGRLAVSNKQQGQGIGKLLLMDALHRSYITSTQLASFIRCCCRSNRLQCQSLLRVLRIHPITRQWKNVYCDENAGRPIHEIIKGILVRHIRRCWCN
jgi:hypothetical protein